MPSSQSKSSLVLVALLFVLWAICFIRLTTFISIDGVRYFSLADDAMISMRYAWNLSHGSGLTWNAGERVEGYTNFLMVLFMSLPMFFMGKIAAVAWVQGGGIAFMLIIAFLTLRIGEHVTRETSAVAKGPVMVGLFAFPLLYYPLTYWALMGMETGLLACCVLYATWQALRSWRDLRITPSLPCVLGLAYLTRPDVLPIVLTLFVYRAWGLYKLPHGTRTIAWEALLLASIGLAHLAFRWYYYGALVPNTYLLKVAGIPAYYRVRNGIGYILPFLSSIFIPLGTVLYGLLKKFERETGLLLVLVLISIFSTVWSGGDAWPYWRMTAPVMPLLAVAFAVMLMPVLEARSFQHRGVLFVVSVIALQMIVMNYKFLPEMSLIKPAFNTEYHEGMVATAVALNNICRSDATIAVTWAGIIPYYTGLYAIDMLGKNDKYIATLPPMINKDGAGLWHYRPGHNRFDLNYSIASKMPDYFQTYWVSFGNPPQDVGYLLEKAYRRVDLKYRDKLAIPLFLKRNSPRIRWDDFAQALH